jgi:short-subunit dehydrogenase
MTTRTWVILGATSIIAEEFAHLAARSGASLLLVGRNQEQLDIIASDLHLRYQARATVLLMDFASDLQDLLTWIRDSVNELDLFIAFSLIEDNASLDQENIEQLLKVNVLSTVQIINSYIHKLQSTHRLIFLSSVAACRGRAKNSLYGGSKALIETYLEGLQQASPKTVQITLARLGFIDTVQTFGSPGIFYASPPKACAKACWRASYAGKRLIYHPFFWRFIMGLIKRIPFFLYKKMKI